MKRVFLTFAAASLCGLSVNAQAIRPNAGFKVQSIPANDDGSSGAVNLGFTIDFFGRLRSSAFVNNNGNITFDTALATFTPFGLQKTAREIIAPFFADVDTRGVGNSLVTYGTDMVNGHHAFGVNYIKVGYYLTHVDKLNSFQVVLIERSDIGAGDFDFEFNYGKIAWETGDASGGINGFGGTPATVGYSNGSTDDGTSFELPGSLIVGSLLDGGPHALIRQHINTTVVGRIVFHARNGAISQGPRINNGSLLPDAAVGAPYSLAFTSSDVTAPFTWSLIPDVIAPPGLSFNSQAGVLSGTPTATGTYTFTVGLTGKTEDGPVTIYQRGSITINSPSLSIATSCPLDDAAVGRPYSVSLRASGVSAGFNWSVDDIYSLPPGLGLSSSGQLAGTPLAPGTYVFNLRAATNGSSGSPPAQKLCRISVVPAAVRISAGCSMPDASVGVPYLQDLTPDGGLGPYTFQLSGQLPTGLALNSAGRLSGTPTVAAYYPFSIALTDSRGNSTTSSCSIAVNAPKFSVAGACPLPPATTGNSYSARLPGGYTWSLAGTLPAGLNLSPDGTVSGTPMSAGPFLFRLIASDSSGNQTGQGCSLIVARGPLSVSGCPLPDASFGDAYTATVNAVGGSAPYLWSALMPNGFAMSLSGIVTGKATSPGVYPFAVQLTDGTGTSVTQSCSLKVGASPLRITACPLPQASLGQGYSAQIQAAGGTAPYRFDFFGYLPAGLSPSQDGSVTGTPQAIGPLSFRVQVTDSQNQIASTLCSVTVALPKVPQIQIADMPVIVAPASAATNVTVTLSQAYSLPVQGQVNLSIVPNTLSTEGSANQPDPRLRFQNGQTSASFTIPAGQTQVSLPLVSTGTVASTVTVTLSGVRSSGANWVVNPSAKIFRIAATVPVVTSSCYTRTSPGIALQLIGYSTTRELTNAQLVFGTTKVGVDVSGIATDYFSANETIRNGGAFSLTIPYDFTSLPNSAVPAVTVNLSNSIGPAGVRTAALCQ